MSKTPAKTIRDGNRYLTFYNYKEPLKKVKNGHGYYGAILSTLDGEKLQCHICGNVYTRLHAHVYHKHGLKSKEYKDKFKLAKQTALISEKERIRLKKETMRWIKNLSDEERKQMFTRRKERLDKARKMRGKYQPKESLETKNKKGTCPDQILDQIEKVAEKIGHVPSKHDFIGEQESQRFVHLAYATFGSWDNALKMLDMKRKKEKKHKLSKKPYVNNGGKNKYSNEELLEYLRIFAQEFNKIPTATDFNRGLLPTYDVYIRRFGRIENARQLANVYEFIDN